MDLRRRALAGLGAVCLYWLPWAAASAQAGFPNIDRDPATVGQLLTATARVVEVCNQGGGACPVGQTQSITLPDGFTSDGRGAMIAYHADLLWTIPEHPSSAANSTLHIKAWDIRNPADPQLRHNFGLGPQPMNAHGYNFHEGQLELGGPTLGLIRRTGFQSFSTAPFFELNDLHNLVCCRERVIPGWVMGQFQPDTEGASSGPGEAGGIWFYNLDYRHMAIARRQPLTQFVARDLWATFDHLRDTGVLGLPLPFGDLLIVASEENSNSGIAIYDLKPTFRQQGTAPTLLGVFKEGVAGGYWPELWGEGDRLYVVFPRRLDRNGWLVVDISDPTAITVVADVDLPSFRDGPMYVQFQDQFAFIARYKVDMHNPGVPALTFNALPDGDNGRLRDMSQFVLPLGNLVVSGGVGGSHDEQALRIWVHQAAADRRGPSVGYHRPRPNQTEWPPRAPLSFLIHETLDATSISADSVRLRPLAAGVPGADIPTTINFTSGGQLNLVPNLPLPEDSEFQVDFVADGIHDVAGNPIVPYSFRFATGGSASGNRAPQIAGFEFTPAPAAPGQAVTFSASATDADGDALQFRFVFGDGSVREWSSQASASHSYANAGRYRSQLQVRDGRGGQSSRAAALGVFDAGAGPAAQQSSTLAFDPERERLFVVNPDGDSVARIDPESGVREAEFAACADPRSLARDGAGRLWIACHDDDRLVALDPDSGDMVASVATGYGSAPFGLLIAADGDTLYASLYGRGELLRIDQLATTRQQARLPLGPTPRALALSPDGQRLLVSRFISPRQYGELWQVATGSFTLERHWILPLRTQPDSSADGIGVPNYLAGVAISPDGQRALVVGKRDNTNRGRLFYDGRFDLDPDNTVRASLHVLDLAQGQVDELRFRDLDNSDSPSAVSFNSAGDYAFVSLQGNNEVLILDALALAVNPGERAVVGRIGVGRAPQGLLVAGQQLLVQNFMDRSVSAFDLSQLQRRGQLPANPQQVASQLQERLSAAVFEGKRIFYNAGDRRMSQEGYISCASCHIDGSSDGRVWDFSGRGEGLRNTIDLRGRAGMGHGLVHWSANFDEIQDFENDIRLAFGGSGFLSESQFAATRDPLGPAKAGLSAELDALAAYVGSLAAASIPRSPYRPAANTRSSAAARGALVFASLDCGSCHRPQTDYRSDGLRAVGSVRDSSGQRLGQPLTGIDSPTLLGLWDNAPYLHDGSAATLAEVFEAAGGRRYPVEAATPSAGVQITNNFIELNDGNSSFGGFYSFTEQGQSIRFDGVDGGSGGAARLELRAAGGRFGFPATLRLRVNDVDVERALLVPGSPAHYDWQLYGLDDLPLQAGDNRLELIIDSPVSFPFVLIDELRIARSDDLPLAEAHRRLLLQPQPERDDLLAFLRELDGNDAPIGPPGRVFYDGFERR